MLARSSKTGELRLEGAAGKWASIAIVDGSARAILLDGEGKRLLELLEEEGGLKRALSAEELGLEDGELTGKRLVEGGYANAAAVSYALRKQLSLRMAELFRWGAMELSFTESLDGFGAPLVLEPPSMDELLLSALRDVSDEAPIHLLRRRIGDGMLKLSSFGAMLLEHAPLYPEEAALLPLLRKGAPAGEILAQARGRMRAIRTLAGLLLIAAVEPPSPGASIYSTLVRKRAQLRRNEAPERLLELERAEGGMTARAAMRTLIRDIHPDRLASAAPEQVRRASTEIVAALLAAEAELERRRGVEEG